MQSSGAGSVDLVPGLGKLRRCWDWWHLRLFLPLGRPKVGFRGHRDAVPSTCCTALSSEQSPASPFLSLQVLGDPKHLGTVPGASLAWLLLSAAVCVLQAGAYGQLLAAHIKGSSVPRGVAVGIPLCVGSSPGAQALPQAARGEVQLVGYSANPSCSHFPTQSI